MTDLVLVTANKINVVESYVQRTGVAAEAITAGDAVRLDTSTGRFTGANGTDAAEARIFGIATKTVAAGQPVTVIRKGIIDGFDLDGLNYDEAVLLSDTDGTLTDDAGDATVDIVIGRVVPGTSTTTGTASDKLLFVDL